MILNTSCKIDFSVLNLEQGESLIKDMFKERLLPILRPCIYNTKCRNAY